MRPAPDLHIEWIDDEAVILDASSGRVHHLNPPAALFFALTQEFGYEAALDEVRTRFPSEPGIDAHLSDLVREMSDKGLLLK